MSMLLLSGALILGVIALTPVAGKIRVPQPVLLTSYGLALGLIPATPVLHIDPRVILPVILPPLLFAATQRTTVREFREHATAVLVLAVGLTAVTAVAVALAAHAVGLPWQPAWVVGAIVSPPDPVAATAVARRLRLPPRLVAVLEGEGMFNDATALVLYKVAVVAAVTGGFSVARLGIDLVLAVVVGVAVGVALGWLARWALRVLSDPGSETTVTAVGPFVAYLLADHLRGSGVLAVIGFGLFLRSYGHSAVTSRGWLLGRSVWGYVDFLIGSLVFTLVGFELVKVLDQGVLTGNTALLAGVVLLTVVLIRPAWIFPAARLSRPRREEDTPVGWRESAVASWAGMRGVVSIATALALPHATSGGEDFPHREEIVLVALSVVLVTLLAQGLTLAELVHRLGVSGEGTGRAETAALRHRAARAGLEQVRNDTTEGVEEEVREAAIRHYEGYVAAQEAMGNVRDAGDEEHDPTAQLDEILGRAIAVERELVLAARRRGEVSAAAADEALRDIEGRAVRDFG